MPSQRSAHQTVYDGPAMITPVLRATRKPVFCILIALGTCVFVPAQAPRPSNAQLADSQLNAKVESLLKKMTLDEKIGQLAQFSAGFATGPGSEGNNQRFDDLVAKSQV